VVSGWVWHEKKPEKLVLSPGQLFANKSTKQRSIGAASPNVSCVSGFKDTRQKIN